MCAKLPEGSRALYRIMTEKSTLGFGKYADLKVGDVIKVDPSYIVFAYYKLSNVSFSKQILEQLNIKPIDKPGTSEKGLLEWKRERDKQFTPEERRIRWMHFCVRGKKVSIAKLCQVQRSTHLTKGELMAINHGHGRTK